ncbi:MAG: hypothetical protein JZU65_12295 [Chlorobium sp.]|nr:hypothetical protein [Chlorobium sp.]
MAPQKKDATGLIAGPLKVTARTDRKDRDKRIVFEAECICGATEFGALAVLGQFQGHGLNCPGHPLKKSNEKPESGFTYFPDQPEYNAALAAWEAARHPGQIKGEGVDKIAADMTSPEVMTAESAPVEIAKEAVTTTEPEAIVETTSTAEVVVDALTDVVTTADVTTGIIAEVPVVTQETPKAVVNKELSTKMSAVLATRLKLTNYHTTSKKLTRPVKILGQDATSVVFAEDAAGTDLVMLHICLCSADGKTKSIVSSMKKIPTEDFSTLTSTLAEMKVTWRSKDQPLIAVAK